MSTPFLYRAGKCAVNSYTRLLLDMNVLWHAPLPAGAAIIAPNHPTTVDPFVVLGLLPARTHILVSETLFKVPVFGRYLEQTGHVRVVHSAGRPAFETARDLLMAGETVTIFPEGALSPLEGGLQPARTGVARLALLTGSPVIPVGIHLDRARIRFMHTVVDGTPETARWYLRGPYAVTFGQAQHLTGDIEDRAGVRRHAARIMDRIQALADESARRMEQPASGLPEVASVPQML